MLRFFSIFLCLISFAVLVASNDNQKCRFMRHLSTSEKKGEGQIELLRGKRFEASDDYYIYDIGICTQAIDSTDSGKDVGVLQINKTDKATKVVGRISNADIMSGPDWVLLEYNNGDPYGSHCKGENRRARIMFICDQSAPDEIARVLGEENNKTESCYYLFEINTAVVCKKQPFITVGLSVGSVLLIVFFSVVAVYLLAGCLYNRFILQAKGLEQIPNLSFWEDFGNLQADGCDLVCRSRKSRQPRTYKGIGDDQLGENDTAPTDEHLLPM
ncbi:cation-dependent mannose-6-phosphate receptor-like [Ruditapes philippinarum]|uniref:cation-dependent mannose-6-phosphate receptor-like n=1 Tax=Ruditapes philippinarum TaxID=129788 RepID=UPI00295A9394|nr:cation-dependent mannose-6-phosphate receptor-like [Ruditapes philippinarum]